MNRLKINIENKILILNETIDMANRLMKGETITVAGLHTISFKKSIKLSNEEISSKIVKWETERDNLQLRLARFR